MNKRNKMSKTIRNICVGVSLLAAGVANSATISFSEAVVNVEPLDSFSLDIVGTGFPSDFDTGALSLLFNPSVLQVDNVSINTTVFNFMPDAGTIDNAAGSVTGMTFARFTDTSTDFTIATIDFTALISGDSLLDLEKYSSILLPDFSVGGMPYSGVLIIEDASVSVSAVPLPAAGWLMLSGLAGLIGVSRKKSA
jgi:hypothetical protein